MQNFDPLAIVKRLDELDLRLSEIEVFKALLEATYSGDIAGVGATEALASKDAGRHSTSGPEASLRASYL